MSDLSNVQKIGVLAKVLGNYGNVWKNDNQEKNEENLLKNMEDHFKKNHSDPMVTACIVVLSSQNEKHGKYLEALLEGCGDENCKKKDTDCYTYCHRNKAPSKKQMEAIDRKYLEIFGVMPLHNKSASTTTTT